ncbi:SGNH/GDSL hydrolase family protein [Listeria ivanovii]|uniref:SGNH/GDSL hydrolase family protein n=1 Tax=Listeria ivanovii TaxID=1638 RepID=UPI00194416C6|nr:SGNH/GDSL hydrolase family protein [Listeria ivanovii]MBM5607577.1 lipase [Listeria ivanovii]MBM5635908.1 lipase [Listeria ivanovii]MBM5705593.1 lipase [Listeria ivanovii]
MEKRKTVQFLLFFSVIALILSIIGVGSIWFGQKNHPASETKKETKQSDTKVDKKQATFKITALGDSLTYGVGDIEGGGYVRVVEDHYKKATKNVEQVNLAISGAKSEQLLKQLDQKEVQNQIKSANIILMTIGGNDLFRGGEALDDFASDAIKQAETSYEKNLQQIYQTIQKLNPTAPVFHIGLYNPFMTLENATEMSSVVAKWNMDSQNLTQKEKGIIYIPTFDLFQQNGEAYLATDKFHPNHAGYQFIGNRVTEVIQTGGGANDDGSSTSSN